MFAQPIHTQRGFTLIELMIGGTVGMIMLFAVSAVFLSSQRASRTQSAQSEIAEEGRFGIDILRRFVIQTGYRRPVDAISAATPKIFPDAPTATQAIEANNTGTNLTLRFQAFGPATYTCDGSTLAAMALGTNDWNQMVIAYDSVNKKLTCTPGTVAVGTTTVTAGTTVDLVGGANSAIKLTGVNLKFGYDSTTNASAQDVGCNYGAGVQGDCVADSYKTATDVGAANWNRVVAVRICMQMESAKDAFEVAPTQKYVDCDGIMQTESTSKKLIRTFTTTVSLRNPVRAE